MIEGILRYLQSQSKEELIAFMLNLAHQFPEVMYELEEIILLEEDI
jgi:hypothetical protein